MWFLSEEAFSIFGYLILLLYVVLNLYIIFDTFKLYRPREAKKEEE